MVIIRTLLLAMVLMALYSGHALAYQYGYYSPNPYIAQPAYYYPYARANTIISQPVNDWFEDGFINFFGQFRCD